MATDPNNQEFEENDELEEEESDETGVDYNDIQQAQDSSQQQSANQREATPKKDRVKKGIGKAGKKAGKKLLKSGGKALAGLAGKHPLVLAVVGGLLLIVLLIVGVVGCTANKTMSEDGSSGFVPIEQEKPEHQNAIAQVLLAAGDGKITFEGNLGNDILGNNIDSLDYRVIRTLAYLSDMYPIGVNLLLSNAPNYTHRKIVSKEASDMESDEKTMEAISSYNLGQAVGISSIGTVSDKLGEACDIDGPVYVEWQEVTLEGTTRPIYEQLSTDLVLFSYYMEVVANSAALDVGEIFDNANELLGLINGNLEKLNLLEEGFSGIKSYVSDSLELVDDVDVALNQGDWDNVDSELIIPVSNMIQRIFRMMQVANMDEWTKSESEDEDEITEEDCRLWKAFEARQNIRMLVADMMKMPVALAGEGDEGFNNQFVVKQLIVYSPEDDLDNGPSDWDVFPPGITSVGIGGVAIGSSEGGDGIVDFRDGHFMSLPIDNGVFSKVCTEFVYEIDETNIMNAQAVLSSLAPEGLRADMCRLLYGNERTSSEGTISGLVSYKKFVHIGY